MSGVTASYQLSLEALGSDGYSLGKIASTATGEVHTEAVSGRYQIAGAATDVAIGFGSLTTVKKIALEADADGLTAKFNGGSTALPFTKLLLTGGGITAITVSNPSGGSINLKFLAVE